ncbi:nudix hydrolase 8 [Cannabis sativa]|uniref:nudix hydrolase 8 n=1 Tax=Cannabis sativa TaxID=3483 RepID=UPI0029C9F03D|nr:nudix hydrolase 8 [Cannabis sativa]XP_030501077.2 nudix hydrolase 8 [Cannabis sativa]
MEMKLFNQKAMSVSEIGVHMERLYSSSFSCYRNQPGLKFSQRLCSCPGVSPNNRYLSKEVISSVNREKLSTETYLSRFNGANGVTQMRVLEAVDDEYGGVVVDPEKLPSNPNAFAYVLRSSLSHWTMKGKKGVWLKLPVEQSEFVPIAVKEGFEYHHAERGYVMLTYWIPEGPSMLPSNASHQVGVGGFVINDQNEVLVVQEKHCDPAFIGLWKIPTGFILESEEIFTGAVREVKEETGIDTEFIEVIAFRHVHNVAFEKSDLFFICMMRPLSTQIIIDDLEIQAAKWMPLVEFVEQPLIQEDSMFKKIMDICLARLGKRYCGLASHQLISKFDGKPSTLYYNVMETHNTNCIGN